MTADTPTPADTARAGQVQSPTHLPWMQRGTRIYFAEVAGGIDVRDCPDPEALAGFIVRACNAHDAMVGALEDLKQMFLGDAMTHLPQYRTICDALKLVTP